MQKLNDLDQFDRATLVKQKTGALLTGFITTAGDNPLGATKAEDGTWTASLEPGTIQRLSPGESLEFSDPPEATGYSDFAKTQLRLIASGLGLPYNVLSGDLSDTSYSSARVGLIEFRKYIEALQWQFVHLFCCPVFRRWIELEVLRGSLLLPEGGIRAYLENVSWAPPDVFRKLVELDSEDPRRFRFAPDAQQLFVEWLAELEPKIRSSELHPALISHLSKYRSLLPSLAVLFELADQAAGLGGGDLVSLDHTKQAAAWCDYLESHATRVYACVTTPQIRAARELADKIKKRKIGSDGTFTCREVYFKGWSGLDTPEAVKQAAEVLEDAGWLQDLSGGPNPSGGRPSNRYAINPKVWK